MNRRYAGLLFAIWPLALFVLGLWLLPVVAERELVTTLSWLPQLGIEMAFRLDGLALLFALLSSGIGALVIIYSAAYLHGHPRKLRFLAFLLSFMTAMLGLVVADDLIALFVFWELTSITSFLLIGFEHQKASSRRAARQALLVTGAGGLALLAGLLLMGNAAGTFRLSELAAHAGALQAHPHYNAIFALVALGAMTKSAQFPFHFWLPNAMAAPTPVSAYLHSATMVKAGIFLLMRLDPVLGGTPLWTLTLSIAGGITMLLGAVWALGQTDLKRLLAYSTLTALGTLTLLIGLSFELSLQAAVVFVIVHALYKGALFLVAGSVDHASGTRDITLLGSQVRRAMPFSFIAAALAGLSMAGLPPLFGFIGKELTYEAKLGFVGADWLLPAAAVAANAMTIAAAAIFVIGAFGGREGELPRKPHEASLAMLAGPLTLAVVGLVFGAYPDMAEAVIAGAVSSIAGHDVPVDLALWHGLSKALALSVLTLLIGIAAFALRHRLRQMLGWCDARFGGLGDRGYDAALRALNNIALATARGVERRKLRHHVLIIVAVAACAAGWPLLDGVVAITLPAGRPIGVLELSFGVMAVLAALVAAFARERLAILCSLGVLGFGVALLFVTLGAVDLAITQLAVETLVVVVGVLVLRRAPNIVRGAQAGRASKLIDGLVAAAAGAVVVLIALQAASLAPQHTAARYFSEHSVPGGHGRNIVNVILVDFRALDTLGEITVVAAAGLGIMALARLGKSRTTEDIE